MPMDLSQPRPLLPFSPAPNEQGVVGPSTGRRAIALKLTEDVLEQIQLILKSLGRGEQAPKGAMRIDLGPSPVGSRSLSPGRSSGGLSLLSGWLTDIALTDPDHQ